MDFCLTSYGAGILRVFCGAISCSFWCGPGVSGGGGRTRAATQPFGCCNVVPTALDLGFRRSRICAGKACVRRQRADKSRRGLHTVISMQKATNTLSAKATLTRKFVWGGGRQVSQQIWCNKHMT